MDPILPAAEPSDVKKLAGRQRAAAIMLALGREHGAPIWEELDEDEIKELSAEMATLGSVPAEAIEHLFVKFATEVAGMSSFHGSYESTQRLLESVLPSDKVKEVMEDIRGPHGRTMWDKLGNVSEALLASYLKNEIPQTVAVVLSKIRPEHAAAVMCHFSPEFSVKVIERMLKMEVVQKDVLQRVEHTLRTEFMSNLARTQRRDPHESMAEVFNSFDRQVEEQLLTMLEEKMPDAAERIRALMFTFEDLTKLTPAAMQVVLRMADKTQLAVALKGSKPEVREVFYSNMSERMGKMLKDEIDNMGGVRVRDVDEAQIAIVRLTKDLASKGEIVIADGKSGDDEIIY